MDPPYRLTHASFLIYSPRGESPFYKQLSKPVSHTSSPYKSHGIEKYLQSQQTKAAQTEVLLIKNRISQLIKSEEKAKKKIELAQRKAEKILQVKDRHDLDQYVKHQIKGQKKQDEENLRKKNKELKEKTFDKIKSYQAIIANEKKHLAQETKKKSKEFESLMKSLKKSILTEKIEKKSKRYTEALKIKHQKIESLQNYNSGLLEEYKQKIIDEKNMQAELGLKKKQLEAFEAELVQRLQNTQQCQVEVLKNLESLAKVSLFQLGIRP